MFAPVIVLAFVDGIPDCCVKSTVRIAFAQYDPAMKQAIKDIRVS